MGIDSALYRIILLLHIGAAIVAFGGVIAHGFYNARAFRGPASAANTLLDATRSATRITDIALYAVLPLGIVLIAVSDDLFGFGDAWVSASFLVWFALVGVTHGAVRPATRTLAARGAALAADPGATLDSDTEAMAASRKLMIGEAGVQLLLVVALILMIWKPGAGPG